jgi:hypothetical protein
MAGPRKAAIERASSMLTHWERKLEFYHLHFSLRLPAGTEQCARWTSFLTKLESKVSAARMRRDFLVNLEEAARLDLLPIDGSSELSSLPAVAERFDVMVAETERRLR